MPPAIYGIGTGEFNKLSIQVPRLIRAAIKDGYASMIGEGKGVWSYVHISDLARLYELVLMRVLKGEEVPSGKQGILFTGTGRFEFAELSKGIAGALKSLGVLGSEEVRSLGIREAAEKLWGGEEVLVELAWGSKCVVLSFLSSCGFWYAVFSGVF